MQDEKYGVESYGTEAGGSLTIANTKNTGSYDWTISTAPEIAGLPLEGSSYRLKIYVAGGGVDKYDYSDNTFTIKPSGQGFVPPTTTPSDWKKYRNDEFGFEFQYPNNFIDRIDNGLDYISVRLKSPLFSTAFASVNVILDKHDRGDRGEYPCGSSYSKYSDMTESELAELNLPEIKTNAYGQNPLYRVVSGEADMQASYTTIAYRTPVKSFCLSIALDFTWSSALQKADLTQQQIDAAQASRLIIKKDIISTFNQVLSTLKWDSTE